MPGTTVLEGPLGAPDREYPEIRVQFGTRSHYAAIDLPAAGDVDQKIANLDFDTMPGAKNPDQFVMVIAEGLAILPLHITGNELWLTLGAQALDDLVKKVKRSRGSRGDRIVTVSRPELGCEDIVIGYRVLGRNKTGDAPEGPAISGPEGDSGAAGPFDGNFQPAFMEAQGVVADGGPTKWVEYLHGPLTFRCERADNPDVDGLGPGDVSSKAPSTVRGPFQTGRAGGKSSHGNGPFGPAFLDDETSENTAAEGDEA